MCMYKPKHLFYRKMSLIRPRIFRIDLNPSNGVLYAGQTLNGQVHLASDSRIEKVTGKGEYTLWTFRS
jgi:hypothetical protein